MGPPDLCYCLSGISARFTVWCGFRICFWCHVDSLALKIRKLPKRGTVGIGMLTWLSVIIYGVKTCGDSSAYPCPCWGRLYFIWAVDPVLRGVNLGRGGMLFPCSASPCFFYPACSVHFSFPFSAHTSVLSPSHPIVANTVFLGHLSSFHL